jgi:hypothetical protein
MPKRDKKRLITICKFITDQPFNHRYLNSTQHWRRVKEESKQGDQIGQNFTILATFLRLKPILGRGEKVAQILLTFWANFFCGNFFICSLK